MTISSMKASEKVLSPIQRRVSWGGLCRPKRAEQPEYAVPSREQDDELKLVFCSLQSCRVPGGVLYLCETSLCRGSGEHNFQSHYFSISKPVSTGPRDASQYCCFNWVSLVEEGGVGRWCENGVQGSEQPNDVLGRHKRCPKQKYWKGL